MLAVDVFCEDGHAQERTFFFISRAVLPSVEARDAGASRKFCTIKFLLGSSLNKPTFVIFTQCLP